MDSGKAQKDEPCALAGVADVSMRVVFACRYSCVPANNPWKTAGGCGRVRLCTLLRHLASTAAAGLADGALSGPMRLLCSHACNQACDHLFVWLLHTQGPSAFYQQVRQMFVRERKQAQALQLSEADMMEKRVSTAPGEIQECIVEITKQPVRCGDMHTVASTHGYEELG